MNAIVATRSPAGFWKRYVAYSIDLLLVSIAIDLLSEVFLPSFGAGDAQQVQGILTAMQNSQPLTPDQTELLGHAIALLWKLTLLSTLAYATIGGAYFALFESSSWQATPGKRMLGIKVEDADGQRIRLGRAFGRFFAAALSWLTFNVGHVMAAVTRDRKALHDFLADTRVENADPAQAQMPAWGWLIIGAQGLMLVLLVVGAIAAVMASINATNQI